MQLEISRQKLSQCVDVALKTTFQVGSFVAVDIAALCQSVNHADHLRKENECFRFLFQIAQVLDSSTSRFFVIAVLQTTLLILTDALQG